MIRPHEQASVSFISLSVSNFPFFIGSRSSVAFCDIFCGIECFSFAAAVERSAFQKPEGALDWTGSDGWSCDGYRYRPTEPIRLLRRPWPRRNFQDERQRCDFSVDLR